MKDLTFYAGANAIVHARAFVAGEWLHAADAARSAVLTWLASQPTASPLGPPQVVGTGGGAIAEIAVSGVDLPLAETLPPPPPVEAITVEAPKADA